MKTVIVGGGVDLAREERLKKADIIIDLFLAFFKSKGFQKALKRTGEVQNISMQLHSELNVFLSKTKKQLEAE